MARKLAATATAASLMLGPITVRADQPAASSVHVVQAGETLWQIAQDAGVDTATLVALNGLEDPDHLAVGQSLKLVQKQASSSARPAPSTASSAARPSAKSYTVADGDTLWAIAQQFGTTTDALVQLNKLDDADHLAVGVVLNVGGAAAALPPPAPAAVAPAAGSSAGRMLLVSYTVQAGETLGKIARQFDVRTAAIAQASGLDDPNRLSVGSVLKVPVTAKEHTVVAGETLRDIALAEKVDLGSLVDFNQLDDPELIRVGQVIVLPVPSVQAAGAVDAATAAATGGTAQTAPAAAEAAAPKAASGTSAGAQQGATATAPTGKVAAAAAAAPANAVAKAKPSAPSAPSAPIAVVSPPPGAPTDGLAGAALKLLGSPYVWGGSAPSGFDCSGLVWYAARQAGKSISRGMLGEYNAGAHPGRDELKVGDLVFFQNTYTPGLSHNGIYIGGGRFVHAADEAAGVTISSLDTAYWSSHWFGATRLPS